MRSLNNIDELLNDEKRKLDNLEVPTTMEDRLRSSLDNTPTKKKKSIRARVAALIIIVLVWSYKVDTLAY